jgi:chromosomal replication initiator protein
VNLKAPSYRLSLSLLIKKEVTIELAKSVVEKFVNVKREISIDYIQKIVSDYFQLDLETLQSKPERDT